MSKLTLSLVSHLLGCCSFSVYEDCRWEEPEDKAYQLAKHRKQAAKLISLTTPVRKHIVRVRNF